MVASSTSVHPWWCFLTLVMLVLKWEKVGWGGNDVDAVPMYEVLKFFCLFIDRLR